MRDYTIDVINHPGYKESETLSRNSVNALPNGEVGHKVVGHSERDASPHSQDVGLFMFLSWLNNMVLFLVSFLVLNPETMDLVGEEAASVIAGETSCNLSIAIGLTLFIS